MLSVTTSDKPGCRVLYQLEAEEWELVYAGEKWVSVFSKSELRIMDLFLEMFLEVAEKRLGKFIDMRSETVVWA